MDQDTFVGIEKVFKVFVELEVRDRITIN